MKFCSHCGKEIHEDAQVCMNCGCSVVENKVKTQSNVKKNNNAPPKSFEATSIRTNIAEITLVIINFLIFIS